MPKNKKKNNNLNVREKDFKVDYTAERKYSVALQRKALEITRALAKAKTVADIERIVKRYNNNPKYLKWAEKVVKEMIDAQDFKSKKIWRMYFNELRGKKSKTLAGKLKSLVEKMKLDDIIKQNEKLIKSFPEKMGEKAKQKHRELVKANVTSGKRASELSKYLKSIGIARADLIARTETGKAATAITERRSENLGLKGYIWKTSLDRRVRLSHRIMRNVICFWNEKPIPGIYETPKNDREVAPGEDFNCRCLSVVIVEAIQVKALSKGGKVDVWHNNKIRKMNINTVINMLGVE